MRELSGYRRLFAFGDIHGCLLESQGLLNYLIDKEELGCEDQLVFIGDYIDRGPDSKGVIDWLLVLKKLYPRTVFLRGNHEDMLLGFLGLDGSNGDIYIENGGQQTLASYGIDTTKDLVPVRQMPEDHLQFFLNTEMMVQAGDFLFVHAGLNPLIALDKNSKDDLLWIRDEFILNLHFFEKVVVFGHTPFTKVLIHPRYKIGIDTGLVYGNCLSCVELTMGQIYSVGRGMSVVNKYGFKEAAIVGG